MNNKSKYKKKSAIIPAAGASSNSISNQQNLPDTMLPINGKPVIGYILDDLIERKITNVIIAISKKDAVTEQYVYGTYGKKIKVKVIKVPKRYVSIVDTIKTTVSYLPKDTSGILICLGDTIYKGKLDLTKNFIVVDKKINNPSKWCIVEENQEGELNFIDKPRDYNGNGSAVCGIYYFANPNIFIDSISTLKINTANLSSILTEYQKSEPLSLVPAKKWYDCGNIENYHKARIDFLKVRFFNGISYDSLRGLITKCSPQKEKMVQEINWYRSLPPDLQIFSPRLISYVKEKSTASYQLEFYGYPSLADLFTFGNEDINFWKITIKRLLDIHELFNNHKKVLPYKDYKSIYIDKTLNRLEVLKEKRYWKNLIQKPTLIINGVEYDNVHILLDNLEKLVNKYIYKKEGGGSSVIHGDLCLSNILLDPSNLLFKFIDPRGSFGKEGVCSIYGDNKYDLAKLRHSFHGLYDFIVADLFVLNETKAGYIFHTSHQDKHTLVAKLFDDILYERGYDVKIIVLIEAILFLSMIPLHSDNPSRQKAMYLTAVLNINNFFTYAHSN